MSTTNMLTMIKEWTDWICWSAHIRQSKSQYQNQIQRRNQNRSSRRFSSCPFLCWVLLLLIVWLAFFVSQVRGSTTSSIDASSMTNDSSHPVIQSGNNSGPIHLLMIESTSSDQQRSSRSRRHCPSCQLAMAGQQEPEPSQQRRPDQQTPNGVQTVGDTARLESIKRQILVKLGLNSKPNLLSTIPPRDFILETLLRAEESTVAAASVARPSQQGSSKDHHQHHHHHHSASADNSQENHGVEDDFYGKTSEIIAFGEPGPRLNGQVLAEFSRVQETAPEPSLRVKAATLWVYVQLKSNDGWTSQQPKSRHHRHFQQPDRSHQSGTNQPNTRRQPTLYVFRLLSHPPFSTNFSLDKNWNELLASQRVTIQHSGWMKINITEGVQKWFSTSSPSSTTLSSSKLQLLVDCSGCGSSVEPVLFSSSSTSQKNKKKKKKRRRRRRRRRLVEEGEEEGEEEEEKRKQHRPFIVIHTDSSSSRRLRRRTPLDCSPTTSACCKQRFFVSFRALGWDDWIIAPSGYYANYCRGDCGGGPSGNSRTPDTFLSYHSHVIDEVRKLPSFHQAPASGGGSSLLGTSSLSTTSTNLDEEYNRHQLIKQQQQQQQLYASLQPCCAPTKFSSMSLIYFGPDMNIIKRDLPKMVVDECGCP